MATGGNNSDRQFTRISDINKEPLKMNMPIRGFEKMPLVSLEEAVQALVSILPEIQDYAFVAKQRVEPIPADGLTQNESAAIMLYTMEWEPHEECLYFAFNATLRSEDRQKLKPWFSYINLFLTALDRLPSSRHFVYRGVKMNLSIQYPIGKTFVWWGFSSCASNVKVLENEQFLGKTGERTLFTIDCESGKDISRHSYFQSEDEILLLAARQFVVKSSLEPAPGLHMIQLKETESPIKLLQSVKSESTLPKPSSNITPMKQSQPTVDPAPPKPVYSKTTTDNSSKQVSAKPKEVAQHHAKPESQEFATPGTYKELYQIIQYICK